ncbi:hypothetical protein Ahy_B09g095051 isoform B [Arachis hypogaea]|uniref:Uncharacterized protein n=1 Tax=Arachis hypogaea TaxID=3818 RepID=A0A444XCU2_ARAHY|nr:hypothetical protein Ahy_B09g095051 isoform B [Arachis hypogaea]
MNERVDTNFRKFVNREIVVELASFIGSSAVVGVGDGDLLVGLVASSAFSLVNYTIHEQQMKTQTH